jgi:hypothetical protein
MKPELRRALDSVALLNNLTDHHIENLAAILLLIHYKCTVPDFDEKDEYMAELNKQGKLAVALYKRRVSKQKEQVTQFMKDNIIV